MKKIIWVFLAVALCACSGGSKSNSTAETKSVTVRERLRMDGWDELGLVTTVNSVGNVGYDEYTIFVKDGHYIAVIPHVLDIDEKEPRKYKYAVQKGSFRIDGELYNGCVSYGPDNNRYFKF